MGSVPSLLPCTWCVPGLAGESETGKGHKEAGVEAHDGSSTGLESSGVLGTLVSAQLCWEMDWTFVRLFIHSFIHSAVLMVRQFGLHISLLSCL